MDNNKFLLMTLREALSPPKFHRYLRTQSPDSPARREQIIPNRILLSDHSPLAQAQPRIKKKHPLILMKSSARKQLPEGRVFPSRGMVSSGGLFEYEGQKSLSRVTLKLSHKKTESSLSLFNKLILTPFNFIRPKPHPNSASTHSLKNHQRKTFFSTHRDVPKSEDRKNRPSPSQYHHRTLEEWRRVGMKRVQQGQAFIGWQTSPFEGEDVI